MTSLFLRNLDEHLQLMQILGTLDAPVSAAAFLSMLPTSPSTASRALAGNMATSIGQRRRTPFA